MKQRVFKLLVLIAVAISFNSVSYSQSKYGTGQDSIECIKNLSLYSEYFKQNNYNDAIPPWRSAFDKCPQASKNLFINGAKMYKEMMDAEENSDKKMELLEVLNLIYTKRIEYYGQKGLVLGFQGTDLLRYNPTKFEEAFNILKESIEIEGKKSNANVIVSYFQSAVFKLKSNTITQLEVLEIYGQLSQILDFNIAKGESDKSYRFYVSAKEVIDNIVINDVKPDCETLIALLQPQYDKDKDNVELLKKIISNLKSCDDAQLYIDAVVNLEKLEPSAESSHNIAKMFYKKKETNTALEYYNKALNLETDNDKKSTLYYEMALITFSSNYQSMNYINNSISLNPSNGNAYLLKAKLIVAGSSDCAKGNEHKEFVRKTTYWVAVDLCNTAKNKDASVSSEANQLISSYSAYFPNNEEIFFQGIKEGENYSIDCWFKASTTVRARK